MKAMVLNRSLWIWLILVMLAFKTAPAFAEENLTYFAPGNILPSSSRGIQDRKVSFPSWIFPMRVGIATGHRAYIGTQLSQYHGLQSVNDPRLFRYPDRENQCEPRKWKMLPCPSGKGHQGVDIRANDNRDNFWPVVAVEEGIVISVSHDSVVKVRSGNHVVRYLHMNPSSIAAAGIKTGVKVSRGQRLGNVSCFMGGACQTSRHLHFDAYTGSAASLGNFYHVYPSLIAAYRRAWGLTDGVVDGELAPDARYEIGSAVPSPPRPPIPPAPPPADGTCNNVALADPLPSVDRNSFASLWRHNCSIMGLIANAKSGVRSFVYFRPKQSVASAVAADPILFEGTNQGGRFTGIAKQYSTQCGAQRFVVEGMASAENGTPIIQLTGALDRLNIECQKIGSSTEALRFTFVERVRPQLISVAHTIPDSRATFSEATRNFLGITFYPREDGERQILPYFRDFPGYVSEGGKIDSSGGLTPALTTDEAGVAISLVWMKKRAQFVDGLLITPRSVAHSMAGVDPTACDEQVNPTPEGLLAVGNDKARAASICNRVLNYLRGYIGFSGGRGFATDYFGRGVAIDETLDLSEPSAAWNWMRTMYSHESGRAPVIDRETFERGIRLGDDYIAVYYDGAPAETLRPLVFYSDPCNFSQPSCGDHLIPASALMANRTSQSDQADIRRLTLEITTLRSRLETLESAVEALTSKPAN